MKYRHAFGVIGVVSIVLGILIAASVLNADHVVLGLSISGLGVLLALSFRE